MPKRFGRATIHNNHLQKNNDINATENKRQGFAVAVTMFGTELKWIELNWFEFDGICFECSRSESIKTLVGIPCIFGLWNVMIKVYRRYDKQLSQIIPSVRLRLVGKIRKLSHFHFNLSLAKVDYIRESSSVCKMCNHRCWILFEDP